MNTGSSSGLASHLSQSQPRLVGVASAFDNRKTAQPLQGCEESPRAFLDPGFQSKPWAGIGERFQRYSSRTSLPNSGDHFDFLCKATDNGN